MSMSCYNTSVTQLKMYRSEERIDLIDYRLIVSSRVIEDRTRDLLTNQSINQSNSSLPMTWWWGWWSIFFTHHSLTRSWWLVNCQVDCVHWIRPDNWLTRLTLADRDWQAGWKLRAGRLITSCPRVWQDLRVVLIRDSDLLTLLLQCSVSDKLIE